jgi:hypothetical protein
MYDVALPTTIWANTMDTRADQTVRTTKARQRRKGFAMRDTIDMAREAGWTSYDSQDERFKTFEALVRADEREAMMQLFTDPENQPTQHGTVTLEYHFEKIKKWEELFERMSDKVLAQRQWVGLTRMDLIKCGVLPFGMSYELCQAIEAKLKEKNT